MNISPITAGSWEDSGQTSSSEVLSLATPSVTEDGFMAPELIVEPCEFWMVWTKTGHLPRVFHQTEAAALAEAERLARHRLPGKKFIVLRAYTKMHVSTIEVAS